MKYSAVPPAIGARPADPDKLHDDYLRDAVSKQLIAGEVVLDFKVQRQGDPEKMPIENTSVYWEENGDGNQQQSVPVADQQTGRQQQQCAGETLIEDNDEKRHCYPCTAGVL
ncbi:MAG: hypothetical protein D3903_15940 [Candidatus Electrothrix sp. GM3_4]|nr:hypothetical protein [Candidatus Electrothrix sp. GM3_4]